MRATLTLNPTLREDPADADVVSHRFLLRAGFVRQLGSGLFTWLPLGLRVLQKVTEIVRQELNKAGAQEILMPVVQPAELWQESGRWDIMGKDMLRMVDRHERDFCFSPTHEEVVTDLLRRITTSYRQLPVNVYQINTKFRDEIRPRFGLLRAREFIMKDGYSFHEDEESLDEAYQSVRLAYSAILDRINLDFRVVAADSGMMGGSKSEEFHILASSGEDELAYSPEGGYAANVEVAEAISRDTRGPASQELRKVATPNVRTIDDIAAFLDVLPSRTVKTLVVKGDNSLVALVLRGDHQLNVAKLSALPGIPNPIEFADENDIKAAVGVSLGSIGPVGLGLRTVVDSSAAVLADFVCGANEDGFHFVGVNWDRDVNITEVADIRNVVEGDPSPDGQGRLKFLRGIEVGHIFKLGTKYSESMGFTIQDSDGDALHPIMGCYGLGVTRLVAAIVEQCHDDKGISWPEAVAPALVHIIPINQHASSDVAQAAEALYKRLLEQGVETFIDDRNERPGVKFTDAELIGIPHRVAIGERSLGQGNLEYRYRNGTTEKLTLEETIRRITSSC